tara:strand:+ start:293 stop:1192 length:900 start_codon:yes stop_codon:yes gene_type:complete
MSTYKITFSSLNHAWANDVKLSESGQDAGDSANPYTDTTYTVTLTLDGSQVAQADVDGSTTLSFDADLSTGDHVLVATCSTGTDGVCVDKFEVGSNEAVASRYKYNEVTSGGSDLLRWKLCEPWTTSDENDTHNVWWAQIKEGGSFLLNSKSYRPPLLAGNEMYFNLTKHSNNVLSLTDAYPGDTNSVMYDSTETTKYYLVAKPSSISGTIDPNSAEGFDSSSNYDGSSAADSDNIDSSSAQYIGPGQYDENLVWHNDSIDDSSDTSDRVVILSQTEWSRAWIIKTWADSNSLTTITVT